MKENTKTGEGDNAPRDWQEPLKREQKLTGYYEHDVELLLAQRDELLAWKAEAVKTSERQLVAFQEMQAVAQCKESEKRNLIAIIKGINALLPEDVQEKVEAAIAKAEGSK